MWATMKWKSTESEMMKAFHFNTEYKVITQVDQSKTTFSNDFADAPIFLFWIC